MQKTEQFLLTKKSIEQQKPFKQLINSTNNSYLCNKIGFFTYVGLCVKNFLEQHVKLAWLKSDVMTGAKLPNRKCAPRT